MIQIKKISNPVMQPLGAIVVYEDDPKKTEGCKYRGVMLIKSRRLHEYSAYEKKEETDTDITPEESINDQKHFLKKAGSHLLKKFEGERNYYIVQGYIPTEANINPKLLKNYPLEDKEDKSDIDVVLYKKGKDGKKMLPGLSIHALIGFMENALAKTDIDGLKRQFRPYKNAAEVRKDLQDEKQKLEDEAQKFRDEKTALEEKYEAASEHWSTLNDQASKDEKLHMEMRYDECDTSLARIDTGFERIRGLKKDLADLSGHNKARPPGADYLPRSVISAVKKIWLREKYPEMEAEKPMLPRL